jgi:hypothetical protein
VTKREREVMKKYTRVGGTGYKPLFLSIDHQEFEIVTTRRVKWFREMLAKALTRMIENEKGTP